MQTIQISCTPVQLKFIQQYAQEKGVSMDRAVRVLFEHAVQDIQQKKKAVRMLKKWSGKGTNTKSDTSTTVDTIYRV